MSKLIDFNSPEKKVLLELFNKMPMMDNWIASVIESYIYSYVRYYYPDGKLKCEYITKYGEKDGECKVWYDNGQLWEQTTYIDDKINGEYKSWFYNGQITKQTTYVDGKKHGVHKDVATIYAKVLMSIKNQRLIIVNRSEWSKFILSILRQ